MRWKRLASATILAWTALCACRSIDVVRLAPERVEVRPGLRPLAGIQASATSFYFFFFPIPGVSLDQVVNQMLVETAKQMGADKVILVDFEATPANGAWALLRFLGFRTARAKGIAVQVLEPAPAQAAQ
ncbi:MAG: hypothetical protein HY698_00380 [Deltaproteobacteria bacterium]|nr:hypothetical protein [Deltaproteobacteria bacterium]